MFFFVNPFVAFDCAKSGNFSVVMRTFQNVKTHCQTPLRAHVEVMDFVLHGEAPGEREMTGCTIKDTGE